jgi:hypothetical protein
VRAGDAGGCSGAEEGPPVDFALVHRKALGGDGPAPDARYASLAPALQAVVAGQLDTLPAA